MTKIYLETKSLDATIKLAPSAFKIENDNGDDKRIEIRLSEDDLIINAKKVFSEASGKISELKNTLKDGFYDNNNKMIKNSGMRSDILEVLRELNKDQYSKNIPLELWDETLGKLEEDLDRFKNRVRKESELGDDEIEEILVYSRK